MRNREAVLALLLSLLVPPLSAQEPGNVFNPTVQTEPYLEPFIPRPEQDAEAASKLSDLEERVGRKPNILLLLVDDMGWGDPGVYGGGIAVGAPTPEGLTGIALLVVASAGSEDDAKRSLTAGIDRLPHHRRPRWVHWVHELPLTATGKIQRSRLRQAHEIALASTPAA